MRPENLETYIETCRENGYSILGIEQSNQSVCLSTFSFPEKCVLVLGDERFGLPAPLLAKMDHVLEIPQLGMIRSLNVHVSGALIVWEYTKQQLK